MIELIAPKTLEEMEIIWMKAAHEYFCDFQWREEDNAFRCEIYKDYRDEIGTETIKEAMEHDEPMEYIEQIFSEWANDYAFESYEYGYSYDEREIKNEMSDEDMEITEDWYENEFHEWCVDHIYYEYDLDDWLKQDCKVNLVIDSGDANYEFIFNSILNWYGTTGRDNENAPLDDKSSILWLAKQQGKLKETVDEINYVYKNGERKSDDKFVNSIITELENLPNYCGMVTFLLDMTLAEVLKLNAKEKDFTKVIISKDTMCGLYEPWNGGGSVLAIELDKDVEIPTEMIWDAWVEGTKAHGYDIDEVYGLIGSAWHGTLKMVA